MIGVLAWNEGVRRIGAANGALFMNLVPVVTFAVEIGRGYRPGEFEIFGALLTIAALVFANLAGRQALRLPVRVAVEARLEPELAHAELVGAEMVRQLVAHRAGDLVAQQVRVVPEVPQQRVAEDDDPVVVVVAGDRVALVEPVGAGLPALVGDDDRDAVERLDQQVGQVVQRLAHERVEVVAVVRVELEELALVRLGREVLARQLLRADTRRSNSASSSGSW